MNIHTTYKNQKITLQKIITTTKEYTDIFYSPPLKSVRSDRFFYYIIGHIFTTFTSLIFITKYLDQNTYEYNKASLTLLFSQLLLVPMGIHIATKSAIEKAKKVVPLPEDFVSAEHNVIAEISRHKIIWLTEKYQCTQDDLSQLSKDIQREWGNWKEVQNLASNGDWNLAQTFFKVPKSDRLVALMAVTLAILASLLVTIEVDKNYLFLNLSEIWETFITFTQELLILCTLIAVVFIFQIPILIKIIKEITYWIINKSGKYELSDRTLYRKLRDMQWLCGTELAAPIETSKTIRFVDDLVEFVFLPIQDAFFSPHARSGLVISLCVALVLQFITSTVTLLSFFID